MWGSVCHLDSVVHFFSTVAYATHVNAASFFTLLFFFWSADLRSAEIPLYVRTHTHTHVREYLRTAFAFFQSRSVHTFTGLVFDKAWRKPLSLSLSLSALYGYHTLLHCFVFFVCLFSCLRFFSLFFLFRLTQCIIIIIITVRQPQPSKFFFPSSHESISL